MTEKYHTWKQSLKTYSNQLVPVIGSAMVTVTYGGKSQDLPLWIMESNGPTLLGRNWLSMVNMDWDRLKVLTVPNPSNLRF